MNNYQLASDYNIFISKLNFFGVDHHILTQADREKFFVDTDQHEKLITDIEEKLGHAVIVSTCNRFEIYILSDNSPLQVKRTINELLANYLKEKEEDINNTFKYKYGLGVIQQLFRVSSGLESMVLGEGQILSQIKKAYLLYSAKNNTDAIFNRLFQKAMSIGKKIRTETSITQGAMSISHVCLQHAQFIYNAQDKLNILILGSGEMAELSYRLFSRYYTEANYLCAVRDINKCNIQANKIINIATELTSEILLEQDIILACTSSGDYIIKNSDIEGDSQKRVIIYDMSMPRNIDPLIDKRENIHLIDLDGIQEIINKNKSQRQAQIEQAEALIQEEINNLQHWCTYKQINNY